MEYVEKKKVLSLINDKEIQKKIMNLETLDIVRCKGCVREAKVLRSDGYSFCNRFFKPVALDGFCEEGERQ